MQNIPDKYYVIDFENTGGTLDKGHKITAVGVVIVEKNNEQYKITDRYSTFVNPERAIEPFVEKLIGIRTEEVNSDKYPVIDKVFDKLELLFNNDKVFVAHCISVDFDMFNFLYKRKHGTPCKCLGIDTHKLAKKLLGYKKCSIGNLYEHYNYYNGKHHQPDFDAEVASLVLIESLNKIHNESLNLNDYLIKLPKGANEKN